MSIYNCKSRRLIVQDIDAWIVKHNRSMRDKLTSISSTSFKFQATHMYESCRDDNASSELLQKRKKKKEFEIHF
jgi:hypothetical protein